jgi:aminomethyltransferase
MTVTPKSTPAYPARTALYDWHVAHGGRMVDFGGWSMPVQYSSILQEHQTTRTAVGLFDVSHMGRLHFYGPDVARFLDSLLTRRVIDMRAGQIRYSLICNHQGGILDDVLVYCLKTPGQQGAPRQQSPQQSSGPPFQMPPFQMPPFQMVVNASNRSKIIDWLTTHQADYDVQFHDMTRKTTMIAVQGPRAISLLDPLMDCNLATIRYYRGMPSQFSGWPCYVSRTGYSGEDGCELIVTAEESSPVWETILQHGAEMGTAPIGLAARDTLRLEAAMPLYGHELSELINPIQAGLGFALNLQNRQFVGHDAIVKLQSENHQPLRIGLQLNGKRVPREGHGILQEGQQVGEITSGTYSPTFERPIAMGYVKQAAGALGTTLHIDIRGKQYRAVVVPLPFYQRGKT